MQKTFVFIGGLFLVGCSSSKNQAKESPSMENAAVRSVDSLKEDVAVSRDVSQAANERTENQEKMLKEIAGN